MILASFRQNSARVCFSPASDAEALKNAEKLLDLMAGSPQMQSLMLTSLPPAARTPEVIQRLLTDPQARSKLVEMIAKQVKQSPIPVEH